LQWEPAPETFALAEKLAHEAVDLDPNLPNAHEVLAAIYLWQKRHGDARLSAETAIAVGPNSAEAYRTLADIQNYSGNPKAAVAAIGEAIRRNPKNAWIHSWTLGHSYLLLGDTEAAVEELEKCVAGNPNFLPAHAYLAVAYHELGREEEAREASARAVALSLPYSDTKILDRMIAIWRELGLS
jgi:Tfp pilus assembly protein PilF